MIKVRRMGTWIRSEVLASLGLLFVFLLPLHSACVTVGAGSYSFGTANSFVVKAVPQTTIAPQLTSCTGILLNLLVLIAGQPPHLSATMVGSTNGFQLKNAAGDSIPYEVFADPGRQYQILPGTTFNYFQQTLLDLLGLLGNTSAAFNMHFATTTGRTVSAGTYTDSFQVQWSWHICTLGAVVCLSHTEGTGITTMNLTLEVTETCEITSAPDISFGQAPTPDSFSEVVNNVSVLCTKNATSFSVGLSPGQHPNGSGGRRMSSGTHFLEYNIYKDGGSKVWGDVGTDRVHGDGTPFDGLTPRALPYEARVTAAQPLVPQGNYTDSIVVDITF
jgi:spore coat protein U-like protein